jgi:hypothetical protein
VALVLGMIPGALREKCQFSNARRADAEVFCPSLDLAKKLHYTL